MCALITKENIKKIARRPYTPREIIEDEFPEMFETGTGCLYELVRWQEKVVDLLPSYKKQVVDSQYNRETKEAQAHLQNYLKLRSLYGFACKIAEQVNQRCRELADRGENQKENALAHLFEAFGKVDFDDIVQDDQEGFHKLEQTVEGFKKDAELFSQIACSKVVGMWTFYDIVTPLKNGKSPSDSLWEAAIGSTDPTKPNIGGLMESEEDNRMDRMY